MGLNANLCASVRKRRECEYSAHRLILDALGLIETDWLAQAKPDITTRMAQYEEGQIEFAILSLVRDPLLNLIPMLAENVRSIAELSARLDVVKPDWRDFETTPVNGGSTGLLTASNAFHGLSQKELDQVEIPEVISKLCQSNTADDLLARRQQLATAQAGLRLSVRDEQQSNQLDEDRACARKCDYGARMQNFVRKVKMKQRVSDEIEAA